MLFPVVVTPFDALQPGPLIDYPTVDNPVGWPPAGAIKELVYPMPALLVLAVLLLATGAAVVVRFRRARGVERQQLKWFAYAAVVSVATMAALPGVLWSLGGCAHECSHLELATQHRNRRVAVPPV
jgi:hypothetical protein